MVGGKGFDTAFFNGAKAGYTITQNTDGSYAVLGVDGLDLITGVEKLVFSDGDMLL